MKNWTRIPAILAAILAVSVALASCATPYTPYAWPAAAPDADARYEDLGAPGDFYKKNIDLFEVRELANGVKLVVMKNKNNRILNLKVVFKDGAMLSHPDKAGIENMTLQAMTLGSKKYSFEDLIQLQYEKSMSVGTTSGNDLASFDLNCIDKYFEELFPVYIDMLMNPAFDAGYFKSLKDDAIASLEESFSDPDFVGMYVGQKTIFAGHPYGVTQTEATIKAISLDDVKSYYANYLVPERMFVVAVGDYDVDALVGKLNATVGSIKNKPDFAVQPVPGFEIKPGFVTVASDQAKDVGYIHGYYKIPNRASRDYVPYALACDMFDDLLFNIVREQNGACYSVGNIFSPMKTSYAILWVYQTTDPEGIMSYIDEAVKLMAEGKIIVTKDDEDKYIYSTIEDRLASYKFKYVNAVFSGQRTNANISSSVARSLVYYGDHTEYLRTIDKINMVSAADVRRVFKQYFLDGKFFWVVVSDEASLKKYDSAAFGKWTTK